MKRTKLNDRILPNYSRGEELANTLSHALGSAFGIVALVSCVVTAALFGDAWAVVGSSIYGSSMILLYTVSSVYHGL